MVRATLRMGMCTSAAHCVIRNNNDLTRRHVLMMTSLPSGMLPRFTDTCGDGSGSAMFGTALIGI
jgi:hypothetical protein